MYTVAPALDLDWVGQRDHLSGDYRGEYWQFTGDEELDPRWTHNLAADLGWRRWAPFFLEVRETLDRGPSAQQRDVEAVIDYTYTNMVSARTGLVWEFGTRGTVELAYRGELETYPQVEDADRVLRQYGEGLARYRWTPLWETEFRVSYGQVDRELTADYNELSASVAVDQRLSEHLALRYRLEWLRDAYEAPPGEDAAPEAARAHGVHQPALGGRGQGRPVAWAEPGAWAYQDDLDYLPDGDTLETGRTSAEVALRARLGSTLTVGGWYDTRDYRVSGREETAWGPTLDARWLIAPWAAFDVRGTWTDTTIREEAPAEIEEQHEQGGGRHRRSAVQTPAARGGVRLPEERLQRCAAIVRRQSPLCLCDVPLPSPRAGRAPLLVSLPHGRQPGGVTTAGPVMAARCGSIESGCFAWDNVDSMSEFAGENAVGREPWQALNWSC